MLACVLLALAIALGLAAAPAHAATRHERIAWGVNRNYWDKFHAAVPGSKAVRVYYDQPDVFPSTWPTRAGKGVWTLLSIRPKPWPLFHHRFDAQLKSLIASAPAHAELTIWHENAVGNNPLGYPSYMRDPARYIAMQEYMQRLVRGSRVRFGTIFCGPGDQITKWLAPHLDWYGYDLYSNFRYENKNGTLVEAKIWGRMDTNLAAIRQVSGERYPLIRLGESNTPKDFQRVTWFTWVAAWFAHHDGNRPAWILTYWNPLHGHLQGGLSGPWPPSASVVRRLRWLTELYR